MASNSLGTLTLDLIAKVGGFVSGMDAAERSSQKWRKEVEKNAKAVGVAIGGAVAAGATALTAITVSTINTAKEITNLSSVANASTTEFQKYAAGAKLVGIEQDKLADIFKDVNDKVGDFLNTGGGALQDFFTNIAPKVGVTADQFRNLSGPQALGLYVSSLEKAKVSQADMTFYLEAIANDATALLPLLRDNAAGFKTLGDAAEAAGAIMDEKTIKASNELAAAQWLVEQSAAGLKNQLTAQLIPVLSDFADSLFDVTKEGTAMVSVGDLVADSLKWMAKTAVGAAAAFDLVGKAIGGGAAVAAAAFNGADWTDFAAGPIGVANLIRKNFDGIKSTAIDVNTTLGETANKWAGYIDGIDKAGSGGTNGKVKELADLMAKLREQGNKPGTFKALTNDEKAAQKAAEQAAKALQKRFDDAETGYERQIALINTEVDKRKDATEVAKLQFEIESGKLKGINAQQQERLNSLATELDRLQKLKQANEDAAKAAAYRAGLTKENDTAAAGLAIENAGAGLGDKTRGRLQELLQIRQTYAEKFSDLAERYQSGEISKDQYDQGTKDLQVALDQRLKMQEKHYEQLDEINNEWVNGVNDAFQNYVDSATNYSQQAADAMTGVLGDATSSISDGLFDIVTGAESVSDAFGNIAVAITDSIIKALADMAAQWLVLQAVQLLTGKTTQASAAAALSANAQATALQAGIAAFASTAAIPIVGPAAAPAAMASALAATEPIAASIGAIATAGAVGYREGGYTGDVGVNQVAGVVHGKEFVMNADATARLGVGTLQALQDGKLDATLKRASGSMGGTSNDNRSVVVNYNDYTSGGNGNKSSSARTSRRIAQAVDAAQRYN